VGVVDADARLDERAGSVIAGPAWFGDPTVGAVQILVRVSTGQRDHRPTRFGRLLVRLQDLEFSGPIAAMQMLRRHAGSVGMGGNGQFTRLSVLNGVAAAAGTPWHGALLEDFELGLHVLLSGSRTGYCHDTWVDQDGLEGLRALVRQRSRWSQGSMQCIGYLGAVLRSANISTAGAAELSYFLLLPWLQLVGTVVYPVAIAIMAWYACTEPGGDRRLVVGRGLGGPPPLRVLRPGAVRPVGLLVPAAGGAVHQPAGGDRARDGQLGVRLLPTGVVVVGRAAHRPQPPRLEEDGARAPGGDHAGRRHRPAPLPGCLRRRRRPR
jgi:hypothetical protein